MATSPITPTPGPLDLFGPAFARAIAEQVVELLRGPVATAMPNKVKLPAAAKIMGVSPKTLRGMLTRGEIGFHKPNHHYLIDTAEIAAWHEKSKIKP